MNCYPTPGKLKAQFICEAFAKGCGGKVIADNQLRPGPAMFYGIAPGCESLWRHAQDGRDYWFVDNAYYDASREQYFRVTKNRLQHSGLGASDGKRFQALGIAIEPWRQGGKHILLCPQSDHFMRTVAGYSGNWTDETTAMLRKFTDRPIRVRQWERNKGKQASSLVADLVDCHALVTWSSAAAVTAILSGVPAIVGPHSAAGPMAITIAEIENPPQRERETWAGVLAANQWTLPELASGAWK